MRWADVDKDAQLIRIPASRMKMNREHLVPISHQLAKVLEEQRKWSGRGDLVFAGLVSGRPISENTLGAALRRLGYSRDQHVPHGFRTTASTLLNEDGWNRDWVERQLAHIEKDKVRGAYNKAAFLDGRREMMQAYADILDRLGDFEDLDALLEN